ncbi:putative large secreted protein [Alloactinosynnema sp. L-07]|uniref:hypothetical protein n=1 Tax=Alloactinosynnema sp. L-07 TaxID=1653480 RepID=UPI00065EF020|nr:hypothetical protein [Alloactinosynnema sp. L-07]CRK57829.1 putative large secreted protein [Alloactinosynnema sp. L-07]
MDAPALPKGWTLSADLDGSGGTYTEAKVTDQNIVLTDGTGAKHTYTKQSAGGYKAPEGEDGILALDSGGRVTLTEGSDVYVFRADGKLDTQANMQDSRKPAALNNVYDGFPSRLKEIRDPVSQRSHTLHYNRPGDACYGGATAPAGFDALPPAQMLCRISYWDGTETRLWYGSGRLTRVENPGSDTTSYSYAPTGPLDGLRDSAAADWVAIDAANRAGHGELHRSLRRTHREQAPGERGLRTASDAERVAARASLSVRPGESNQLCRCGRPHPGDRVRHEGGL